MAVNPISVPLAAGLLAADFSPWTPEAQARSAIPSGLLGYSRPSYGHTGPTYEPKPASHPSVPTSVMTGVTGTSGLPMPEVEGYKYVYPRYQWDYPTRGEYGLRGYEEDIDKYEYYPYYPGSVSDRLYDDKGKQLNDILVGLKLIKK